jgi:transcription initiation factor TFIIIB Brf1 subunit/transcription initiation factor TFIIB
MLLLLVILQPSIHPKYTVGIAEQEIILPPGLYTIIGKTDKDGAGHRLDASIYSTIKRLRTWDLRTQRHTATAINVMQAFYELDILKNKLALLP